MRPLSRIGWFCVLLALVLEGLVYVHYHGLTDPAYAISRMLASAFWGGLALAGLFVFIMAALFLNA